MANFNYRSQFMYSNAGNFTKLLMKVSIGAAGAPTIVAGTGMGITSMARTAAGRYVITLSKSFNSLLGLSVVSRSGASAPAAPGLNITTDAVSSSPATITIQFRDIAAAAADPASGEVLYVEIDLNSSSLSN